MCSLITEYYTGKFSFKRFQSRFPAQHKMLINRNENQSIITKKCNPILRGKNRHGFLWSRESLSGRQGLSEWLSKLIGVRFRESQGNINYSLYSSGWTALCAWIEYVGNSSFFQSEVVLQTAFSPGSSPGWVRRGRWGGVWLGLWRRSVSGLLLPDWVAAAVARGIFGAGSGFRMFVFISLFIVD